MTDFEPGEAEKIKKGTILTGSWGYDATNNEFCKVLKNTKKNLICQKLKTINAQDYDYQKMRLTVIPDPKSPEFAPFRIKIDNYVYGGRKSVSLKGQMPLSDDKYNKVKVYWRKWNGSPAHDTER